MAEHSHTMSIDTSHGSDPSDFDEHRRTYVRFLKFCRYGALAVAIVMIFLFWVWYG